MKNKNEKYYYLAIFIVLLLIMFLSPISGDDWGNYLVGKEGLHHMIGNAIGMYFDWEGRFISRLLINFLTFHKIIWNFVNSFIIMTIIYLINKIINPKNKKTILLLSTLIIFLINIFTFSQTIVWLAGNITYLFVIPLILFYFYYILKNKKSNNKGIVALSILNIIMTMFVEHIGLILVTGNLLILISRYIKNKKLDYEIFIYALCSIIGITSMLLSPGSLERSKIENIYFSNLSIIEKIIYNLPNFIYYTFSINCYLIVLMTIANYYLVKNNIKNKDLKTISYLYLLITPIIVTSIYLINSILKIEILCLNNTVLIAYFITYIIIDLILIYLDSKLDKPIFFYLIGIGANTVMLMSPTWGYRTSLATYIFLSISFLIIIDKYIKNTRIINDISYTLLTFSIMFFTTFYISIYRQYRYNVNSIKNQLNNNETTIEIVRYPSFANCNINPENEYHIRKFKEYYGIGKNIEIKLIDNNWKYFIFYKEKEVQ